MQIRADGKIEASRAEVARWVGVTPAVITQHDKAGRLTRIGKGYDLEACVQAICANYRETSSGRGGAEQVRSLTEERARLAAAQAEAQELKNSIANGLVVKADDVEREWGDILRKVRSRLLAVPSRVRARLGHVGQMEAGVIDREIRDALVELGSETDADAA